MRKIPSAWNATLRHCAGGKKLVLHKAGHTMSRLKITSASYSHTGNSNSKP